MAIVPFVNLKVPAIVIGLLLEIDKDARQGELSAKIFLATATRTCPTNSMDEHAEVHVIAGTRVLFFKG
jgi:hypothetical protein